MDRNYGFAGGVIKGLAHAQKGKYFALLNPDTLTTETWLSELVKVAQRDPRIGATQSLLLNVNGTADSAGGFVNFLGYPMEVYKGRKIQLPHSVYEIGYAKGAAVLLKWNAYADAGV